MHGSIVFYLLMLLLRSPLPDMITIPLYVTCCCSLEAFIFIHWVCSKDNFCGSHCSRYFEYIGEQKYKISTFMQLNFLEGRVVPDGKQYNKYIIQKVRRL